MPTFIAGDSGNIEIEVQQTSTAHQFLLTWLNTLKTAANNGDLSQWAGTTAIFRTNLSGSIHQASGISPMKVPDKTYAAKESTSSVGAETKEDKTNAEEAAKTAVRLLIMNLDRSLFKEVQAEALKVVFQLKWVNNVQHVLPVVTFNGQYALPELEYDIATVMALTSHALIANFSMYFEKKELLDMVLGLSDTNL
ncbi:unnamed protein product [Sphagnum jensenii]|uniref:Uncharacterized protein n=1 Tax=Sphagnum jensenii TaxID=128206 RepID=A0ABP0VAP6_9BRYO